MPSHSVLQEVGFASPAAGSLLSLSLSLSLPLSTVGDVRSEVGDRWAPEPDTWGLSSGATRKLWSHPDAPRTKLVAEAELC